MERPGGVTAIAVLFLAVSGYLATLGLTKLARPEAVSLSLGASFLHGMETAGPYAFLIASLVGAVIAVGLLRLNNLARRAAIIVAVTGVVLSISKVSAETGDFSWRFVIGAVAVIFRVMIAWYLWQSWTAEKFGPLPQK